MSGRGSSTTSVHSVHFAGHTFDNDEEDDIFPPQAIPTAPMESDTTVPKRPRGPLKRSFTLVPERIGKAGFKSRRARKSAAAPSSPTAANGDAGHSDPEESSMYQCEVAMKMLAIVVIVFTFPFCLVVCMKVIAQYERAVVFRLGRLLPGARGPGLIFVLPCLDTMKIIDLRTFTFDVPTQEVLTKDSVTVAVDAVVYYRIFDPVMSVVNVEDANRSTRLLAATTLRNVLGTMDLYQLLTDRENIAALMQECLDVATDTWGVKVERVEVKDVRLPIQLQRAMAAEAEATREARAKVIAAEGEEAASKSLKRAGRVLAECPMALQLRYLQTLSSISAEKNSTIIFPLPIDIIKYMQKERGEEFDENSV